MSLINCETKLDWRWARNCVLPKLSRKFREVDANADPVEYEVETLKNGSIFQKNNAKLCVTFVKLSVNDNINFSENIKHRFKRTTSWYKYRSKTKTQPRNDNSDYLIEPTSRNINRLFFHLKMVRMILVTINGCYMPLVEIKDFNSLIENKPYQPVKPDKKRMKKLLKCQKAMIIQQDSY